MIRIVQIACIAVTALILYAIGKGTDVLGSYFGEGFDPGFVFGMLFAVAGYLLIIWVDPSSRPRGSASKQD